MISLTKKSNSWRGFRFKRNGINRKIAKTMELHYLGETKTRQKRDKNKNFAVSSDEGYVNAYIFERGSGLNTLDKKWADEWRDKINKDYSIHKIKKKTLSQILKNLNVKKKFELLNIDVEGHEQNVINGASNTIKKNMPILLVEIEKKHTQKPIIQTINTIKNYGYNAHTFSNNQLVDVLDNENYYI